MSQSGAATEAVSLDDIFDLAHRVMRAAGSSEDNAGAVARTIMMAERDGSTSHGLFRLPGYVATLKSGKVNGDANPRIEQVTPALLRCDAQNGHAPLALERGVGPLADAARACGVAVLALTRLHHFAALWPETEALTERGVAGFACVSYTPMVAPAGGREALFGTNPISFAWPRPGQEPLVFDMATAALAMGDVQIAARDGHEVPLGTGLDASGNATTDPAEILKGVLLPFGGYKGSALAMMVELLAGPMVGEFLSFEAEAADNGDGGPVQGGEFLLALAPDVVSGADPSARAERLFARLNAMPGVRLPGDRRHANRRDNGPRHVNAELLARIEELS